MQLSHCTNGQKVTADTPLTSINPSDINDIVAHFPDGRPGKTRAAGVGCHVPFGGTRGSSYGPREQGFAAVEFYTQVKTVYVGD